jgi:SAM-dependent methyltransferase/uncharacterized protein YbaR (Trm112 family)
MKISLLGWMRCPFCGSGFEVSHAVRHGEELEYGLLGCACDAYPVVAGIPVLLKRDAARIDEVRLRVRQGLHAEALTGMLDPGPPALAHRWIRMLPELPVLSQVKRFAHRREMDRLAQALASGEAAHLTACDLLHLYFHNVRENYNYLSYRFGQPRQLVALSFATLIQDPARPVLDLGCGCGHITFSLTRQAPGRLVVGTDTFFFGLFLAKHWIATEAEFVCCAADAPQPFPDGAFSTAFCSDSFHYFEDKPTSIRELERLTGEDGLILSTGMHNALVQRELAYGLPLTPEGYGDLVAHRPYRLVADADVLARYFERQGPPLAASGDPGRLARAPLLSLAASRNPEVLVDHGTFPDWPHARGRLCVNFLYRREGTGLRRTFPSPRFEADTAEIKPYLPETVDVSPAVLNDVERGERSPGVEDLVGKGVVLGVPERYGAPRE